MASVDSNAEAPSGRNRPPKSPGTRRKSAKPSTTPAEPREAKPAQATGPRAKDAATPDKQGDRPAEHGSRIRVQGRFLEMIRAELFNLEKTEAVLRCLAHSMDSMSLEYPSAYLPDVVEVAGDLVQRTVVDLDALQDGYIPNRLMAARKIER